MYIYILYHVYILQPQFSGITRPSCNETTPEYNEIYFIIIIIIY